MKNEIGFYSVNGVSFSTNKVAAVLEAQKTNAEVKWNFFDEIFDKVDWTTEPSLSLDTLYEMRARQIRSEYDYVIVFLSGGADSNNVIRTFMRNNIHVDEVIALIPESGIKNYNHDDTDYSADNLMSETKYAQYPILQEVHDQAPNTKITIMDFFDDLLNMESDTWIYESEGDLIGVSGSRYGKLDSLTYLKDMAEAGKRIATVWGTDKPVVRLSPDGSQFNFILVDSPVYLPKYPFKEVYPNVDRVLFYYTHQLPELMVKQAHVVAREVCKPENAFVLRSIIDQTKKFMQQNTASQDQVLQQIIRGSSDTEEYSPKTVYQRGIVPFIYPSTYDKNLFQVRKFETGQTFLPAFNNWIRMMHGDCRIVQMISSDFTSFYKNVSAKYLNPNKTGFQTCVKIYRIGKRSDFEPKKI